jgi:hypothetical protein
MTAICSWDFGYIDTTGREVIPIGSYSHAKPFSEGLAVVGAMVKHKGPTATLT